MVFLPLFSSPFRPRRVVLQVDKYQSACGMHAGGKRARSDRPRNPRAAEQRDEVAASHVGHRRAPVQPAWSACHKTGGESFSRRDSEAATGGNGLKRAVISYTAGTPSPNA